MATLAPVRSVCAALARTTEREPGAVALRGLDGSTRSWAEYRDGVRDTAAGLAGLGAKRGSTIVCWLQNRPEFHVTDAAALHLGAATISFQDGDDVAQAERLLLRTGARIVVTEPRYLERAVAVRRRGSTALDHIICVGGDDPGALGWDELLDAAPARFDFESIWRTVDPGDIATLDRVGDGPPRPVTHGEIALRTEALRAQWVTTSAPATVAVAPMTGLSARLFSHYLPIAGGWEVTCCPAPQLAAIAIAAARPSFLHASPRLWERLWLILDALSDRLERAAIEQAAERVRAGGGIGEVQYGEFQSRMLRRVGLERVVRGAMSAPCDRELLTLWRACGIALVAEEPLRAEKAAAPLQME